MNTTTYNVNETTMSNILKECEATFKFIWDNENNIPSYKDLVHVPENEEQFEVYYECVELSNGEFDTFYEEFSSWVMSNVGDNRAFPSKKHCWEWLKRQYTRLYENTDDGWRHENHKEVMEYLSFYKKVGFPQLELFP